MASRQRVEDAAVPLSVCITFHSVAWPHLSTVVFNIIGDSKSGSYLGCPYELRVTDNVAV